MFTNFGTLRLWNVIAEGKLTHWRLVFARRQHAPVRPWDVAPTSIQLALARGYRWLAMLESGEAKSLKEIAVREGIDNSYVSRMVNLTTLAPDIVAAILDDALPSHVTLFDLAVDPPALWDEQRERLIDPAAES